jgi:NitT/TauT family transport system substrate-binding protein
MKGSLDGRVWRLASLAVCVCGLTCLTTACGTKSDSSTSIRIAIGGQSQMVYLPTTLAQELGFYKEEGLEVELQDFEGGAKALQALMGGSADVVSGYYDHTIQMAAEGRELLAFVTTLRYPGFALVSTPKAAEAVATIRDLQGRVVGVTSPGSSSHMFLTSLLTRHQVPVESVSVTAIGGAAAAVASVESGRIDAAWLGEPALTVVRQRNPGIRILADLRTAEGTREAFGVSEYPAAVLYSTGPWVREHRELAARLTRAVVKTLVWMAAHSELEIAAAMPKALRGDDEALYVEALKSSRAMFSVDGRMSAEGAAAVRQVLDMSMPKVHDAAIDLSKTYTNEFVQP